MNRTPSVVPFDENERRASGSTAVRSGENGHPPLESIAAYLDGNLALDERKAVSSHLDSCPACYEIYAESLHFQKAERAERSRSEAAVLRKTPWFSSPGFRTVALPLAAVLFLGVGFTIWRELHRPLEPHDILEISAGLAKPDAPILTNVGPFDAERGAGEESTNYPVVAFQSSATLVDFRVASDAENREMIDRFATNLNALYSHLALDDEQEKAKVAVLIDRLADEHTPPPARLETLKSLAEILRRNSEGVLGHYELGQWTESGRLAAYGKRPEFFKDPKNHRALRWFLHNKDQVKEDAAPALAKIDDAWDEAGSNPEQLAPEFEKVIKPYNESLTVD